MARVIDGHTHAFSPDVIERREEICQIDEWFLHLYENPRAKLTGETELLASMERSGIDHAVIAGFPWTDPGMCREHNAWMAEVCRAHPDRLSFLGIVAPNDRDAGRDAEAAFNLGAIGIGELNADAQGFVLDDPADTAAVVEVCKLTGKPLMFHTSEPVGHSYPGKGTATPDKLVRWLEAYSEQPVIFAHWGGGLPFYELMPEIRALAANAVYDCAATTYLYDFSVFQTVLDVVGPERIIFGSDFPVLGQRRLLDQVRAVVQDSWIDDLLGGNARRLFDFESGESE
ncbi:MAG: amidohydrolase family protein [Thermomicrobiales bacterium]